jgi:hypothetical protein|tara:strand:+ start:25 stop:543 length:519 start_codon:yes stop_codon:yes gene_type:complete
VSTIKVDTLQSRAGGAVTFTTLPIGASAAGSAAFAARFTAATGATWSNVASAAIIPFNDASSNDAFDTDSVFNTSTYKFTAPATGVYTFWFSIYTANSDTNNGFGFLKNSEKVRMQAAADGLFTTVQSESGDHIQNGTVIIPLSSGDTIAVCGGVQSDYYSGYSQFGGCRLA